jgi:hypothetical protein
MQDLLEPLVAKAKRQETSIRLDVETAEAIKKAAILKGFASIGDYVRASFMPVVRRDLVSEGKKLAKGEKPE